MDTYIFISNLSMKKPKNKNKIKVEKDESKERNTYKRKKFDTI